MYVCDTGNHRILKYVNGSTNGITIAGIDSSAGSALNQLNNPRSFAFDENNGYMYIADCDNDRIMRYFMNSISGVNGVIVAGGTKGNTNTTLNSPYGVAFRPNISADLYIANTGSHSIIRWTPGNSAGVFVTGTSGTLGSTSTTLNEPLNIKIDNYGNIYVADSKNYRIQMFCANSSTGITIAGTGFVGNGSTQFDTPRGIAFDSAMNMYIADFRNQRMQKFLKL